MKIYGLVATGPRRNFSGTGTIQSKQLWWSAEQAEAAKPNFIQMCTKSDPARSTSLMDLEGVTKVEITEWELVGYSPPEVS